MGVVINSTEQLVQSTMGGIWLLNMATGTSDISSFSLVLQSYSLTLECAVASSVGIVLPE